MKEGSWYHVTGTQSSDSWEDFVTNRLLGCSDQKVNKEEMQIGAEVRININKRGNALSFHHFNCVYIQVIVLLTGPYLVVEAVFGQNRRNKRVN